MIGGGQTLAIGICVLFYIYRSAISCAKFGVAVLKASILDWRQQILAIGICALFYIYRSAIRCAKFGVAVFKASMLDCKGRSSGYRYMCIVLYT